MARDLIHSENYRGHRIEIYPDDVYGRCQFDDWDGDPPIAVLDYDRHGGLTSYAKKYGDVGEPPTLTARQISKHREALKDLLGYESVKEMYEAARSWADDRTGVNDLITNHFHYCSAKERIELLEPLWQFAGCRTAMGKFYGYCQGDVWEILVVGTPEFYKATGAPKNCDLEYAIQLFGDWVVGNVYGYVVKKDGETVDSCWGFYPEHVKDGAYAPDYDYCLMEARYVVDSRIKWSIKEHAAKVKAWIKNRVPLIYREPVRI